MREKVTELLNELNNEGMFNLPFITDSEIEKIANKIVELYEPELNRIYYKGAEMGLSCCPKP